MAPAAAVSALWVIRARAVGAGVGSTTDSDSTALCGSGPPDAGEDPPEAQPASSASSTISRKRRAPDMLHRDRMALTIGAGRPIVALDLPINHCCIRVV